MATASSGASAQPRTIASSPEQSSSTSVPGGRLAAGEARSAITHGTWNSRLTIPMWLRTVPLVQMMAGELVVDRREERGPGVAHEGDHPLRPGVHQGRARRPAPPWA